MLENIWTYLKFGHYYCGIEHTVLSGGNIICTLLKKSKKQLEVEVVFSAFSMDEVSKKIPKKQHVSLIVNDSNVLCKEIESEQSDHLKLVHKAFPNIHLEDFYYEVLHGENTHFVSLCRKQHVDDLIDGYTKHGVSVISYSIGNTSISSVQAFVSGDTISTSNALLTKQEDHITSLKENKDIEVKTFNVNGLEVNNKQLLSLSGALQTVLEKNNKQSNFEDKKDLLLHAFLQFRFFNQFLKFTGVFVLGILLFNFLFFNHYFSKVNELQQTSVIYNSAKERIVSLNESVGKKQKMTQDMLSSNASKSSFYVNDIIQSIPNSILLSTLNYQPLEKRIKENKGIALQKNILLIAGASSSSETFSSWINTLESKDWVQSLEIIDYGDVTASKSNFSIKITINNE